MGKTGKIGCIFLCAVLLLGGCRSAAIDREPPLSVVTQVDVYESGAPVRHYTSSPKMEAVLNYLRLLRYRGMADTAPAGTPTGYEIRLLFSDGSEKAYRQLGALLYRDGQWEKLDPKQACRLPELLAYMPSDPATGTPA